MVIYDNEFETKTNKIWTKDKIEPQHMHKDLNLFLFQKLSILISPNSD